MPRDLAHDFHVVIRKTEGRRFRCTAEPWPTCLRLSGGDIHAAIIPPHGRGKTRHAGDGRGRWCPATTDREPDSRSVRYPFGRYSL